jgi:hypothetical protein
MLSEGTWFNCSENLYGDIDNNTGIAYTTFTSSNIGFFMQMFGRAEYEDPINEGASVPNPFYFATGAQVTTSDLLATDPEVFQDVTYDGYAILLSCKSTVYDFTYTYVNGSVTSGNIISATIRYRAAPRRPLISTRSMLRTRLRLPSFPARNSQTPVNNLPIISHGVSDRLHSAC